ncbi:hypothetical protein J7E70_08240 [Variovorax paradoxus]|nr:hypothetical protein [Variovorax paradoxus]MBT2300450.1 hypothetical protein [Variovorax paradoxus]
MTHSQFTADAMVRVYLRGRTLPEILHGAVVWVAETRLSSGKTPVLDQTLRTDIDNQAIAPPKYIGATSAAERPAVCALLQPAPA